MVFHMITNHLITLIWLLGLGAVAGGSAPVWALHQRRMRFLDISREDRRKTDEHTVQHVKMHDRIRMVRSAFAGLPGAICGSLLAATAGLFCFALKDHLLQGRSQIIPAIWQATIIALVLTAIAIAMLRYAENANYAILCQIASKISTTLAVTGTIAAIGYALFWLFSHVEVPIICGGLALLVMIACATAVVCATIHDARAREERRRTYPARRLAELQFESWAERERIRQIERDENIRISVRERRRAGRSW